MNVDEFLEKVRDSWPILVGTEEGSYESLDWEGLGFKVVGEELYFNYHYEYRDSDLANLLGIKEREIREVISPGNNYCSPIDNFTRILVMDRGVRTLVNVITKDKNKVKRVWRRNDKD